MRRYGCLQAIVMSFYSRELYRDVAKNWGGGVLLYLLLVLTICWLFLSVHIQKSISVGYASFAENFFHQLPEMTIQSGKLQTPENRPYLVKDSDNKVTVIIDTSGQYKTLKDSPAEILVTKDAVYYQNDAKKEKSYSFGEKLHAEIKPLLIKNKLSVAVDWLWILLFPFLLFFSFIYRIVQAALYGLIGELFAILSKIPLTYGEIFKLTIFAITPSILIGTALDWFVISFHHLWLCHFILSMGYLVFAIRANKH